MLSPLAAAVVLGLVSDLGSVEATATWLTAVGVPSGYQPPADAANCEASSGDCPPWLRIDPRDPNRSTVVFRAAVRDPYPGPYANQMPPVASHRVPAGASETLARWIMGL